VSRPQRQPRRSIEDLRDACLDGAECLYDPELHDGPDRIETAEQRAAREQVAAEVCATCPALADCLTYALRTRPTRGVWAGLPAGHVAALADIAGIADITGASGLGEVA
jgi:hypothetical protein